MKTTGTVVAIILFLAIVAGAGYGIFAGYKLISSQWRILNSDWRACLIIIAAVLILCSLFISASIGSYIKKHGLTSTGKVMAYKEFIRWYSDLKSELPDTVEGFVTGRLDRLTPNQQLVLKVASVLGRRFDIRT